MLSVDRWLLSVDGQQKTDNGQPPYRRSIQYSTPEASADANSVHFSLVAFNQFKYIYT
jgi:hypothetical protein